MFASLIVPALAVRQIKRHALWFGYLIGVSGYLVGIVGSALIDLPTGPLIVWSLFVCAVLFLLFRNGKGLAHAGD